MNSGAVEHVGGLGYFQQIGLFSKPHTTLGYFQSLKTTPSLENSPKSQEVACHHKQKIESTLSLQASTRITRGAVPPTHHHRHHCLCWTTQSKSTNHYSG
jgi:hypothetical protein